MRTLYFDVETTGLPSNKYPPNHEMQPHITQLGMILEINGIDVIKLDALIKPDNWRPHPCSGNGISKIASELTGITVEMCEDSGIPIADAMEMFIIAVENADAIVCHNQKFDTKIIGMEYTRIRPGESPKAILMERPPLCTMVTATPVCNIKKKDGKAGAKWPTLTEAMKFFFDIDFEGAHSAIVDITATQRIFHELIYLGAFDEQFTELKAAGRLPQDYAL